MRRDEPKSDDEMDQVIRDHCWRAWNHTANTLSGVTIVETVVDQSEGGDGSSRFAPGSGTVTLANLAQRVENLERKMARLEMDDLRHEELSAHLRVRPHVVAFVSTVAALIGLIVLTQIAH
jgi:hypothetical protein